MTLWINAKVFCFTSSGAIGRFIRRRPSQQQLRARSEDTDTSKSKLPRSRSERVLSTKKRDQRDNEEDGFSVQELTASFSKLTDESDSTVTVAKLLSQWLLLNQNRSNNLESTRENARIPRDLSLHVKTSFFNQQGPNTLNCIRTKHSIDLPLFSAYKSHSPSSFNFEE